MWSIVSIIRVDFLWDSWNMLKLTFYLLPRVNFAQTHYRAESIVNIKGTLKSKFQSVDIPLRYMQQWIMLNAKQKVSIASIFMAQIMQGVIIYTSRDLSNFRATVDGLIAYFTHICVTILSSSVFDHRFSRISERCHSHPCPTSGFWRRPGNRSSDREASGENHNFRRDKLAGRTTCIRTCRASRSWSANVTQTPALYQKFIKPRTGSFSLAHFFTSRENRSSRVFRVNYDRRSTSVVHITNVRRKQRQGRKININQRDVYLTAINYN